MRNIYVVGIVVGTLAVFFVTLYVAQYLMYPQFEILDFNYDVDYALDENRNPIRIMTVWVKIHNDGANGTQTVVCQITHENLTTVEKRMDVFIPTAGTETVEFTFKTELKGEIPHGIKAWIE